MGQRIGVVLAAGKGTRMQSQLPKVLFPVCGRPMVEYVLETLQAVGVDRILIVVGYRSDLVREALATWKGVEFVDQPQQLGTGHAVKMCAPALQTFDGPVVVLTGDSPLTQRSSLEALFERFDQQRPACLLGTLHKQDPSGLGRIVRDSAGQFVGIVEEKDATAQQRAITEVNMSTYVFDCQKLLHALEKLRAENEQNEYYLTDCPGILKAEGHVVEALPVLKPCEALSINTLEQLAVVEQELAKLRSSQ